VRVTKDMAVIPRTGKLYATYTIPWQGGREAQVPPYGVKSYFMCYKKKKKKNNYLGVRCNGRLVWIVDWDVRSTAVFRDVCGGQCAGW
jgi:hypothetical protein